MLVVTNFLSRFIEESFLIGPFLTNYYGIGQKRSKMLCRSVGVPYHRPIRSVSPSALKYLERAIAKTVPKDFLLRRQVNSNLSFKYTSNSLAGQRLYQGLPSRRQRTKTNARTARRMKIDFTKIILLLLKICVFFTLIEIYFGLLPEERVLVFFLIVKNFCLILLPAGFLSPLTPNILIFLIILLVLGLTLTFLMPFRVGGLPLFPKGLII